jgi:hypothetical protein
VNACSANLPRPVVARSASISPHTGANLKPLPLNAVATTIEPFATVSMIGGSDLDNLDAQLDR